MLRQPFTIAVLLTAGGLIPFLLVAIIILFDPLAAQTAIQVLISYGAVILSFVGAVHWGFALRDVAHPIHTRDVAHPIGTGDVPLVAAALGAERQLLVFGIIPAMIGWIALLAMIHFNLPGLSVFLLLAGFFIAIVAETIGKGRNMVASNYLALRWAVSIVVLITLLAVLFAVLSGMRMA